MGANDPNLNRKSTQNLFSVFIDYSKHQAYLKLSKRLLKASPKEHKKERDFELGYRKYFYENKKWQTISQEEFKRRHPRRKKGWELIWIQKNDLPIPLESYLRLSKDILTSQDNSIKITWKSVLEEFPSLSRWAKSSSELEYITNNTLFHWLTIDVFLEELSMFPLEKFIDYCENNDDQSDSQEQWGNIYLLEVPEYVTRIKDECKSGHIVKIGRTIRRISERNSELSQGLLDDNFKILKAVFVKNYKQVETNIIDALKEKCGKAFHGNEFFDIAPVEAALIIENQIRIVSKKSRGSKITQRFNSVGQVTLSNIKNKAEKGNKKVSLTKNVNKKKLRKQFVLDV